MANIACLKEALASERRCALLPANVKAYTLLGAKVIVESGIGEGIFISDDAYRDAGAEVLTERADVIAKADLILAVDKPALSDVPALFGKTVISFLDPFNQFDYVGALQTHKVTSFSMEMIPRSTRCQKMDALSSQASLAGYVMVTKAIAELQSILPMMMTAAGTIKPAKVFVIGAGVAGLQAIATAKRLGAAVTAFDTRSVVAEQVRSLGAKFLEIDLGETGQTAQGYAQALTKEQMQKQREAQAQCIAESDIVITTAQLFGRKPPQLIDLDTLKQMKHGSVIVDMAAQSGGNVAGSVGGDTVTIEGVKIIGTGNWSNEVALNASQMYANNLFSLVSEFWHKEQNCFEIDLEDDIQSNAVITHQGEIINSTIRQLHQQPSMEQAS